MEIGKSIRYYRKSRKMFQHTLAEKCKVSQAYISSIEKGKSTNPSNRLITKICTALEIPEAFLYLKAINVQDLPPKSWEDYNLIEHVVERMIDVVGTPKPITNDRRKKT